LCDRGGWEMAFFWLENGFFALPALRVKRRGEERAAGCKWLSRKELGRFVAC
jgi:hypothetical protein